MGSTLGQLVGKVAVVGGASRGIGKATALAFAREGASVVVVARSVEAGALPGTIHTTAEAIEALGATALPIRCDITVQEDVEAMVDLTMREFGRIDVLVNNAALSVPGYPITELPVERWDEMMAINLRGTFLCCKVVLPHMIAQSSGSIINVTSLAARRGSVASYNIAYGVTKAGLDRFTVGLAAEVKEHNIAVNALEPTMLRTEKLEARNPADYDWSGFSPPETIGPPMVFLAQQDASGFSGQVVGRQEFRRTWP